jgi:ssDNA-binding Zn-finger/Zn-ribbon topoisomerase 1
MTMQTCSDCGTELSRPHPENANYVRHENFSEQEPREVHYAVYLTEEAGDHLDMLDDEFDDVSREALAAGMAHPDADETRKSSQGVETLTTEEGTEIETEVYDDVEFSFPTEDLDHVRVESPNVVQDDEDVALTYTNVEKQEVMKTALVCPDCTPADAEIMWGVDA